MNKDEQIQEFTRYFEGYKPIVDMFIRLIEASYVETYDDYVSFKARIESNKLAGKDTPLFGFLPEDTEHTRTKALYIYLPNICIGWIPLSVTDDLTQ